MKKVLLLAVAVISFQMSYAQKNIVKVNPVGIVFGVFNAEFEHAFAENSSFTIGASYLNWKAFDVTAVGADLGYRYYFSKNNDAPEGIYVSPFVTLGSYTNTDTDESAFAVGFGGKAGYQWIWESGLALDLNFGYGYQSVKFDSETISGGLPQLGLALGYAF